MEKAREGKGRRWRGVGRGEKTGGGRQGSVIILLIHIRREMKGMGKKKTFKLRKTDPFLKMETEYLKPPCNERVNDFALPI